MTAAFQRLQSIAMQQAAEAAQVDAAKDQRTAAQALLRAAIATEETAKYTKNSIFWLMVSVIVLALSSIATVCVTIWDHYAAVPK